ncbi:MAG: hypothetical protein M3O50_09370 [Myxococcota bacterium]|nr:hypothetical protein [Myxococcota bacterium]
MNRAAIALAGLVVASASCVGTTGGGLVKLTAYASGPPDATSPLAFDTRTGFHVSLRTASMHIGAVYLTTTPQNVGSGSTSCIEPGQYIAEVPGGADVDLLSSVAKPFAVQGDGSVGLARTGEVWLTGGNVNAVDDSTKVVVLQGTATRGGNAWPFRAQVTIGSNRSRPVTDPAQPGLNPICKRRIVQVSPIATSIVAGASLYVRVDPRGWFNSVDFSQLDLVQSTPSRLYEIPDSDSSGTAGATAGRNLLTGILTSALPSGASAFSFDVH